MQLMVEPMLFANNPKIQNILNIIENILKVISILSSFKQAQCLILSPAWGSPSASVSLWRTEGPIKKRRSERNKSDDSDDW